MGSNPIISTNFLIVFFVYILQSQAKGRLYVGHTDDLEQRLGEHNFGLVKSTRPYRPWVRVYTESFETRSQAAKREREIKAWKSAVKIRELIGSD